MKTWAQLGKSQANAVKMLTNSIKKNRVAHAYLFEGGRGTGKKDTALLLAKSMFCRRKQDADPCGECSDCRRIDSGNHPDVHLISPEGLSIKISQIRELQKEFAYTGMESSKKMYVIEHADRMTNQAANSLLKFLEEPGKSTVAILLTEQVQQMLPTILSRCQVLSFQPLSSEEVAIQLNNQGITNTIAKLAAILTNDFNDALKLASDEWFVQARALMIQLIEVLDKHSAQSFLFIQEKWLPHFKEREQLDQGLDLLLLWQKDLLNIQVGEEEKVIFTDQDKLLKQLALRSSQKKVTEQIGVILEAKRRLSANMNPQLLMEQTVLRLQEG